MTVTARPRRQPAWARPADGDPIDEPRISFGTGESGKGVAGHLGTGDIGAGLALSESMPSGRSDSFEDLGEMLGRLSAVDRDCLRLHVRDGIPQEAVAALIGVTSQSAVSWRVIRARRRLQLLRSLPRLEEQEFRRALRGICAPRDVHVVWTLWETQSQTATARLHGVWQPNVRQRLVRVISVLSRVAAEWPSHPAAEVHRALAGMLERRWWSPFGTASFRGCRRRWGHRIGLNDHWRFDATETDARP